MAMKNKPESNVVRYAPMTKLVDKHHSPLVIRKYTRWGFPIFIAVITDDDLSDLDSFVHDYMEDNKSENWVENLQALRNFAGDLTQELVAHYEHAEGVAVVFYVDKAFISSLYGDFMNHLSCKQELQMYLSIMPHI